MVEIQHACHAVKTEAIELILVHPESEIAEEESKNFMMAVVEQPAVPLVVSPFAACMEVLMVCPVKLVDAIQDVLGRVAVNHIKQNSKSHAMSSVNKLLKILRGAIAAACGKEVVDLVAKAGIVSMLHNGHKLDDVVSKLLDAREHVLGELLVCGYTKLRRGNSNMGLVDTHALGLLGARVLECIPLTGWGIPEPGVVGRRYREILRDILDPRRKAIYELPIGEEKGDLIKVSTQVINSREMQSTLTLTLEL